MYNQKIPSYSLGHCYCKHREGDPRSNEIMCIENEAFEQLDPCNEDEWCIGPKTQNESESFSSTKFCSKG